MISNISPLALKKPFKKFPVFQRQSFVQDYQSIQDEEIDLNYKTLL
jgi:hypothetical protein